MTKKRFEKEAANEEVLRWWWCLILTNAVRRRRSLSLCQHFEGESCHLGGRQRPRAMRLLGQFQERVGELGGGRMGVAAFVGGVRASVRRQGEARGRGGGRRGVARRRGVLVEAKAAGARGGGRVYSTYIWRRWAGAASSLKVANALLFPPENSQRELSVNKVWMETSAGRSDNAAFTVSSMNTWGDLQNVYSEMLWW